MEEITKPSRKWIASSWTTLTIPLTNTFADRETENGKLWTSIIRPLTRENLPGFLHGLFGRVTETPEVVWLVTGWEFEDSLQKFEGSAIYSKQQEQLAKLSTTPPETIHCRMSSFFWNTCTVHTSVTDYYFPYPLDQSTHDKILSLRGCVHFMSARFRAYNTRGERGWMEEVQKYEGMEVSTIRFMDYWLSEELERRFKSTSGAGIGLWERFLNQCKEEGLLGMREVHCAFESVPGMFFD